MDAAAYLAARPPGRALDVGCGHGSDTLWLAARGWQSLGVDFAATALAQARWTSEAAGADLTGRVQVPVAAAARHAHGVSFAP